MTTRSALVTGASSGIGEAFCMELARRGHEVALVARNSELLKVVQSRIGQLGGKAIVIVADLSQPDGLKLVTRWIEENSPDIVVHNAGFGVSGQVGEASLERLQDMVAVHVQATLAIGHATAQARSKRGSGDFIVVSSIAGALIGAGSATYCSTKAFQTSFARSMNREWSAWGGRVLALCPGYTRTRFHDTPEYAKWSRKSVPNWMWMEADQVVLAALQTLAKGKEICIPGWRNRMVIALSGSRLASWVRKRIRKGL